jgi:DNA-binding beta-propeller fold protein YncE
MQRASRLMFSLAAATVVAVGAFGIRVSTQAGAKPTNALPNPYQTIENHFKLPEGRTWGSISAVDIDKDGRSIWIAERCGGNSDCMAKPTVNPILLFDASGKLVRSFGAGTIASPHGIFVDRDGNVWVTDYSDNAPRPARGAAAPGGAGGADAAAGGRDAAGGAAAAGRGAGRGRGAAADPGAGGAAAAGAAARGAARGGPAGPVGAAAGATIGHQVFKFSPEGKLLMALGKAGGARDPEYFYQPNDVQVAPNGDIFVAEGHGGGGRILKFDRTGKFIKQFGAAGSGPGQFNTPHALAMDSRGRLFVGDRGNNRVQLFDQEGKFLEEWLQFGRPSGVYIDKNDVFYAADSESSPTRNTADWKRGIRIGSARDGKVTAFIPDPWTADPQPATTAPEGVAADAAGNVYGAEVTERGMKKYLK